MNSLGKARGMDELLAKGRRYGPSPDQLDELAERLGPLVGPGGGSGPGGGHAGAPPLPGPTFSPWIIKGIGVGLTVAAAGGAAWWMARGEGVAPPPAPTVQNSAASPTAFIPPPIPMPPPLSSEAAAPSAVSSEPTHRPPVVAKIIPGPNEASLIDMARAAVAQNPARALSLVARHRQLFPSGLLTPERNVIEIEALQRLGRSEEAERSAKQFEKEHPDSALQPRVRAVLGEGGIPVEEH